VTLRVEPGELVALVGANGAGKSTLLRTIAGLVRPRAGIIRWQGEDLGALSADVVVERGIAMVPEGRKLFGQMTVEENLQLGAYAARARAGTRAKLEEMYRTFPRLRERRSQLARSLSGGEQQMLAIARALMAEPRLLLMDEPSLGLAPKVVQRLFEQIQEINRRGLSILMVEQNARQALKIAHYAYLLEVGRLVGEGPSRALEASESVQRVYLGG